MDRLLVPPTDAMPPNFGEKTCEWPKVFSFESFPLSGSPEVEMDIQPGAEPKSW